MQEPKLISPSLLARTALEAAPLLLGQTLVRVTEEGEIRCRIVETESYGGAEDRGSHAFGNKRTNRTEVMFAVSGIAYVYLIYGMYSCLNVVVGEIDDPQAVLIRAVEPMSERDQELMLRRRGRLSGKSRQSQQWARQAVPRAADRQEPERIPAVSSGRRSAIGVWRCGK